MIWYIKKFCNHDCAKERFHEALQGRASCSKQQTRGKWRQKSAHKYVFWHSLVLFSIQKWRVSSSYDKIVWLIRLKYACYFLALFSFLFSPILDNRLSICLCVGLSLTLRPLLLDPETAWSEDFKLNFFVWSFHFFGFVKSFLEWISLIFPLLLVVF